MKQALGTLSASELFVLATKEDELDLFELDGGSYVLAFDTEERLVQFMEGPANFVSLSGRSLAQMLAAEGHGIGLNLDVAPSSILLPDDAVEWLAETTGAQAMGAAFTMAPLRSPDGLSDAFLKQLDARLAQAAGMVDEAYLVGLDQGRYLLGLTGALKEAETLLVQIVTEAVQFSGQDVKIETVFFDKTDPALTRLSNVGLRFDVPKPSVAPPTGAPGSDPDKPPKLR